MNNELAFAVAEKLEEIHVEITTLCNAECPMCAREEPGMHTTLGYTSWKSGDAKKVFNKSLPNAKRAIFCGTHGDPLSAPYLFEALEACKELDIEVQLFTNASLRSEEYWDKMLSILTSKDKIIFAIDGIETNHLYRRNTNIDKILRNLEKACKSSVKTRWDFLAFEHNEHEIEKAKNLAKEMGVDYFNIRKTPRFKNNTYPVKNKQGEVMYFLNPPKAEEYRHPNLQVIQEINKKLPDNFNIECVYKRMKKIYINSRLEVFPCCYISDDNESRRLKHRDGVIDIPISEMNLNDKTWEEILSMPFYQNEFVESFTNGKVQPRCIKTCGVIPREANQQGIIKL